MNNVKKSIGWADYTWNPITGCLNGCEYCYARRIYSRFGKSFDPKFHEERLLDVRPLKIPSRIFCGSVTDFWSEGVKQDWRIKVYLEMQNINNDRHTFFILTKRPEKITQTDLESLPKNLLIGTSITGKEDSKRIVILSEKVPQTKMFVSIEPLLGEVEGYTRASWVIIGGLSPRPVHKKETINKIIKDCAPYIPVYIKDNAKYPVNIKEFNR